MHGNLGGKTAAGLGTFSAGGNVAGLRLHLENGNLASFTVARQITSSITLDDPSTGNLPSIKAGGWDSTDVTARTVGSLTVTGNLNNSHINFYAPSDPHRGGRCRRPHRRPDGRQFPGGDPVGQHPGLACGAFEYLGLPG